jgi:hypothetical protein
MATEQDVNALRASCAKMNGRSVAGLVSRSEWGPINFQNSESALKTAVYLFAAWSTLPIEILPDQELSQVVDAAKRVEVQIDKIDKFTIDRTDNPRAQADSIGNQLRAEVDNLLRQSSPLLPFVAYYRGDIQAQLAKIEDAVGKASKLYDDGQASIDAKAKQIDDALTAARTAAAKAGAAVFTQDFLTESSNVDKVANRWLIAAAGLGALALVAALASFIFFQPSQQAPMQYLLQYTVTKLVVIGSLITAAIWCGSIYRALKHQAAINKHRGNALKTFQAFVEASGDNQDVRNAVLLETTRSIFAVAPTGFLNATETNVDSGLKITDALKSFGKS